MPKEPKKAESEKAKVGRPSLYKPEYARQAFRHCLLGATDPELAALFDVSDATIDNWKNEYPEFLGAIRRGKQDADANVATRLYRRALGYKHKAVKIMQYEGVPLVVPYTEHYPPDTNAARYWLNNRQRGKWRDRAEVTGADGAPLKIVMVGEE